MSGESSSSNKYALTETSNRFAVSCSSINVTSVSKRIMGSCRRESGCSWNAGTQSDAPSRTLSNKSGVTSSPTARILIIEIVNTRLYEHFRTTESRDGTRELGRSRDLGPLGLPLLEQLSRTTGGILSNADRLRNSHSASFPPFAV